MKIVLLALITILLEALAQSLLLELLYDLLQILVHWLRGLTSHPSRITRGETSLSAPAMLIIDWLSHSLNLKVIVRNPL